MVIGDDDFLDEVPHNGAQRGVAVGCRGVALKVKRKYMSKCTESTES